MNFRFKHNNQGWIVEYKESRFSRWKHLTNFSGLEDMPYYYKTAEKARDGALDAIKDKINHSFYFTKHKN